MAIATSSGTVVAETWIMIAVSEYFENSISKMSTKK